MEGGFGGESLSRQCSSGTKSSRRVGSMRELWNEHDVFRRSSGRGRVEDDDDDDAETLIWAAIERLPTHDMLRKWILKQVSASGRVIHDEVDLARLEPQDKQLLVQNIPHIAEQDNDKFLRSLRTRIDRVGIELPQIEVRYENLTVEGEAYVGTRALPTLLNSTLNTVEGILGKIGLSPSKKRTIKILHGVSGIVKPSRLVLLLGPPGSGKTTLLKALAGKPDNDLKMTGRITYCGHEFKEFVPQRTSAYISQHDLHHGEMSSRDIRFLWTLPWSWKRV